MSIRTITAGVVAGVLLLSAGCGGDDDDGTPLPRRLLRRDRRPAPSQRRTDRHRLHLRPSQIDRLDGLRAADGDVPQRIVSLSPTATEMLFAIGAGDQVIAVDDQSNYPAEATVRTDLSGFTPNVEAIAGYEPDLVVTSDRRTSRPSSSPSGSKSWEGPAATTLDDTYAQIEQLGAITGHVAEAAELVGIDGVRDRRTSPAPSPTSEVPLTLYHELDPTLFSADSTTFIGAAVLAGRACATSPTPRRATPAAIRS